MSECNGADALRLKMYWVFMQLMQTKNKTDKEKKQSKHYYQCKEEYLKLYIQLMETLNKFTTKGKIVRDAT
eukprot:11849058-Ditylum_brightwellii.AAC.1